MENLFTQMSKGFLEEKVLESTPEKFALCKHRFEAGKSYLDTYTGYGVYVKERKGNKVLVDIWYDDLEEGLSIGERNSWEQVWINGDSEVIGYIFYGEYGEVFCVCSDSVIK